mmetsp:Transcript_42433/g.31085  ORF Transcript_42433/g.31085 Transcript_42433/m.31085 type:complete len:104 (+) Transcript_42433:272-583(+)
MITKSQFDHIAVIIRYSNQNIAFIESAHPNGVELVDWDHFKFEGYHKNYDKIVYRKLTMERSYEKMRKLEHFIKVALNKKYKCNPSKILRKKNTNDFHENIKS